MEKDESAYVRARLGNWLEFSEAPGGEEAVEADKRQGPKLPFCVVEIMAHDCTISVPFDAEPGMAERYAELWAKAFEEVRCCFRQDSEY